MGTNGAGLAGVASVEKKRRVVGSLFQREGAALRKYLSENLSREVSLG